MSKGYFVISLDFELMWGVLERSREQYGENVLGARAAVPRLLELFRDRGIHCTWATVGLLFSDTYEELVANMPEHKPCYADANKSAYTYLAGIGRGEDDDPYHYAASLIRLISKYDGQEIGSHTFSHFYALEDGQSKTAFEQDLQATARAAKKFRLTQKSLVFPRNQVNTDYLDCMCENGIVSYRGNEKGWMYSSSSQKDNTLFKRMLRLADAYINLSGANCYAPGETVVNDRLVNIRASRFLRPFSRKLKLFEGMKIRRIKAQMKYAARRGLIFHLWWHPHNFGINTEKNLETLEAILDYYGFLHEKYGFESHNMHELAREVLSLENCHAHRQGDILQNRL